MQTPASGVVCCGCDEQIHMDYRGPVERRDSTAPVSVREGLNPCLDRLLLLFWVHYIEDGPHLLGIVSL